MNQADTIKALRDALSQIIATLPADIAEMSTDEIQALLDSDPDPKAEGRDQAEAVIACRQALALTADASEDAPDSGWPQEQIDKLDAVLAQYPAASPALVGAGMAVYPLIMAGERNVREMLVDLHREYQRRAEPLIKHLVAIEATKPPAPFVLDWMLTSAPAAPVADAGGAVDGARLEWLYQSNMKPFIAPIMTKAKWLAAIDGEIAASATHKGEENG